MEGIVIENHFQYKIFFVILSEAKNLEFCMQILPLFLSTQIVSSCTKSGYYTPLEYSLISNLVIMTSIGYC